MIEWHVLRASIILSESTYGRLLEPSIEARIRALQDYLGAVVRLTRFS